MPYKKYTFSFTAASALVKETMVIAELYLKHNDWSKVEMDVIQNNVLQKNKTNTIRRELFEIKKRLSNLNQNELNLLVNGDMNTTKMMIYLSIVKTYSFIYEFVNEVLNNKFIQFERYLSDADYAKFIDSKTNTHPELEVISEKTVAKVKQVTFKILEQIGIIDSLKTKMIIKPYLENSCVETIVNDNPMMLSAFLYSDGEIKNIKNLIKV